MIVQLHKTNQIKNSAITISGSKSETNRALLLQAFFPDIAIENSSNSDDSLVMQKAICSQSQEIDVHHAGTAMRFLTAYFSIQENKTTIITGSERMKQRPIKILVEALRQLGAEIDYLENDGFPPLKIHGKKRLNNLVSIDANLSSQYISALLLIAPSLPDGISINLHGEITSRPYIEMTLRLLEKIGVKTNWIGQKIMVQSFDKQLKSNLIIIESDWSSASYWYSIVAFSEIGTQIELSNFFEDSLQADAICRFIFQTFGVATTFSGNQITLQKVSNPTISHLKIDLNNAPDIAQTVAVTCFGLNISCEITGLHTLKIKETDRLLALKTELSKLGASISITDFSLSQNKRSQIIPKCTIETYQDHRMAMAFAPLALLTDININEAEVVSKSYPNFWKDLEKVGFQFTTK